MRGFLIFLTLTVETGSTQTGEKVCKEWQSQFETRSQCLRWYRRTSTTKMTTKQTTSQIESTSMPATTTTTPPSTKLQATTTINQETSPSIGSSYLVTSTTSTSTSTRLSSTTKTSTQKASREENGQTFQAEQIVITFSFGSATFAIGVFLAVKCYRRSSQTPSTNQTQTEQRRTFTMTSRTPEISSPTLIATTNPHLSGEPLVYLEDGNEYSLISEETIFSAPQNPPPLGPFRNRPLPMIPEGPNQLEGSGQFELPKPSFGTFKEELIPLEGPFEGMYITKKNHDEVLNNCSAKEERENSCPKTPKKPNSTRKSIK